MRMRRLRDLLDQLRHRRRETFAAHQHQVHADIERPIFARQCSRVIERRARGHQRGGGEDPLPMSVDDSFVHITRVAEVVGIRDQVFQAVASEYRELDAQELLGVGAEVLHQEVHLARGAVQVIVQLWIHQQLADGPLAGIHLIDHRIDLGR